MVFWFLPTIMEGSLIHSKNISSYSSRLSNTYCSNARLNCGLLSLFFLYISLVYLLERLYNYIIVNIFKIVNDFWILYYVL